MYELVMNSEMLLKLSPQFHFAEKQLKCSHQHIGRVSMLFVAMPDTVELMTCITSLQSGENLVTQTDDSPVCLSVLNRHMYTDFLLRIWNLTADQQVTTDTPGVKLNVHFWPLTRHTCYNNQTSAVARRPHIACQVYSSWLDTYYVYILCLRLYGPTTVKKITLVPNMREMRNQRINQWQIASFLKGCGVKWEHTVKRPLQREKAEFDRK